MRQPRTTRTPTPRRRQRHDGTPLGTGHPQLPPGRNVARGDVSVVWEGDEEEAERRVYQRNVERGRPSLPLIPPSDLV